MSNKKKLEKTKNQKQNPLFFIATAVAVIAIAVVLIKPGDKGNNASSTEGTSSDTTSDNASSGNAIPASLNENGDVVIEVDDITEDATFYSYDLDGTDMGLLVVRASDGTIRTAFDTCQICNGSPYAYFTQQDDKFQCQNCGNIYSVDMIEQERGGCNPVPIMADEKTVTDTQIIIPAQLFEDNAERFENWKQF